MRKKTYKNAVDKLRRFFFKEYVTGIFACPWKPFIGKGHHELKVMSDGSIVCKGCRTTWTDIDDFMHAYLDYKQNTRDGFWFNLKRG